MPEYYSVSNDDALNPWTDILKKILLRFALISANLDSSQSPGNFYSKNTLNVKRDDVGNNVKREKSWISNGVKFPFYLFSTPFRLKTQSF